MVGEKLLFVEAVADAFGNLILIPLHLPVHIVGGEEVSLVGKGRIGLHEVVCRGFRVYAIKGTDKEPFDLCIVFLCSAGGYQTEGGEGILHACSLCVRDIRLLDGDTIAALIGLNPNGGGVALCDFRRHKDDITIFSTVARSLIPAAFFRPSKLCRAKCNGKFLLF